MCVMCAPVTGGIHLISIEYIYFFDVLFRNGDLEDLPWENIEDYKANLLGFFVFEKQLRVIGVTPLFILSH